MLREAIEDRVAVITEVIRRVQVLIERAEPKLPAPGGARSCVVRA